MKILLLIMMINYPGVEFYPKNQETVIMVESQQEAAIHIYKEKHKLFLMGGPPEIKSRLIEVDIDTLQSKDIGIPHIVFYAFEENE